MVNLKSFIGKVFLLIKWKFKLINALYFEFSLFCIPVFGGKSFLIFPIIDLTVDLKLICIIGLSDLINSLIFANIYPG